MFKKIKHTNNPPNKDTLVWDGDCGFCKFWKTRWQLKTGEHIDFETYQDIAEQFPDIPLKEFKKASRLIEANGKIYSGPDSAYRTLYIAGNTFWHNQYANHSWFEAISDISYNHIAKNRSFYFKLTKILFGSNPIKFKPFWIIYLLLLLTSIILVILI